jgi:alanine dehydrogenase
MIVGVPKERRPYEYRVGLPPAGVSLFLQHGHQVYVESGAGVGAGFRDQDYGREGAQIAYSAEEVFGRADLALKFTRPLREELESLQEGAATTGFLHLAAARQDKLELIADKQLTALAYELVQEDSGERPIMAPLSQIGGRMAVQIAARLLQNDHGGRGILLGGLAGVPPAEVMVLGAGVAGRTAAAAFLGAGAHVTVLDKDLGSLQALQAGHGAELLTLLATPPNIRRVCAYADVLVGAVAVPGERSPVLVDRQTVAQMKPRALILDLSIDQGGCVETSRPTDHGSPTYLEEGVLHYCVPNISGVLGRTATHALFMAAYPYFERIATLGLAEALRTTPALARAAGGQPTG